MDRPTPRPSPRVVAAALTVCLAWLVYAVLAMGDPLIGLLPILLVLVGYGCWRFLVAVEAAADGLQRIAAARERED